ncbi:MAG TPA: gephyrin-like molybdotransferase Glp [Anaeromyxobacteraceae bacterium]|nr:gephyrin-like molybdotransferase Glp [Anaeromyxobacteraceae bacterium]
MPTFEAARKTILDQCRRLPEERVPVLAAVGRVLAADVPVPWSMPRWDNSAMDGFAVRSADCAAPTRLRVTGYLAAGGRPGGAVGPGEAVKIMTGAPLPPGADAVVRLEDCDEEGGAVALRVAVRAGSHVRREGEDLRAGEVAVPAGAVLGASEASLLASAGCLAVPVVRRARVAVLSTGDELVPPGAPLEPGQIHDSNSLAVAAAVLQAGGEPVPLGIARDDRASLREKLERGLQADALVTTAGVSMGDRDLVRAILDELGVRQVFWKVDIKPGRPVAFATRGGTLVFSLPGNPVSTLLTFEEFVRPALLRMMGHGRVVRSLRRARLADPIRNKPGRVTFVRVRLSRGPDGELVASSAGDQDTGILRTQLRADGIAVIPADRGDLAAGEAVDVQVTRPGLELEEA